MEKNFLKYYKGEKECPLKNDEGMLWMCEKSWCVFNDEGRGKDVILEYLDEYTTVGLSTFRMTDDVPISLKAIIFNRFAKTCNSLADAVEPFMKLYDKHYHS